MMRLLVALAVFAATAAAQGMASRGIKPQARPPFSGKPWLSSLADVARQAGLTHRIIYGAEQNVQYASETSSGGVAFFDYDNDGFLDIYFVGGTTFGTPPAEAAAACTATRGTGPLSMSPRSRGWVVWAGGRESQWRITTTMGASICS